MHPLAFTGPRLALPQELGGGTYLQLPRAPFGVGGSNISLPGSSYGSGSSGSNGSGGSAETIPPVVTGVSFGTPSPYRGIVTMSHYVSNASTSDEYVQISVPQNAGNPVDITGWTIGSAATANQAVIPKGTEVPTSGVVNAVHDIVLLPGQNAIIFTGKSPVGASFRENKCIGYFGSLQRFTPSLPQNCPTAANELSTLYGTPYIHDPTCIAYADTISRCKIPPAPSTKISQTCEDFFVQNLNYNGCINLHQTDADFNGNTWRIYLGRVGPRDRANPLWRIKYEAVKLLDTSNRTVDAFSY